MEKRIRRMGIFLLLCFLALFIQLNNIQIFKANALANDPSNPNVIAAQENLSRGNILSANGVILASSVPSVGTFSKYQRVYDPATVSLFSQIVGYDSPIYGMTGIESEYNSYLQSHTTPATTLRQLLVSRTGTDNVTLTISTTLQQDVANALNTANARGTAPEAGAVVLNVKTGAIEAMYGNPTYDPTPLVSPKGSVERVAWNSLITAYASNPENSPVLSRAFQRTFLPGSTFKVVTSSAVFDHQPALARKDYPVVSCIPLPQSGGLQLCNYAGANGVHESCGGTIEQTLPSSCNTAFAQMGEALGGVVMNTEAQGFGFNHRIPLDLPYVPASTFPSIADLTNNTPLSEYSAFGQATSLAGDSASALQMALVAEGIANNGVIMTPHVMNRIVDDQGGLPQPLSRRCRFLLLRTHAHAQWLRGDVRGAGLQQGACGALQRSRASEVGHPKRSLRGGPQAQRENLPDRTRAVHVRRIPGQQGQGGFQLQGGYLRRLRNQGARRYPGAP